MIKLNTRKKNKPIQYVVGGTVAVIILGVWVSMPLMNNSSMSSSVSAGNPFKSKVADISSLGSEVSLEGGAPGAALSGEMINNPATSGESILSSLFQSGSAEEAPAEASAAASAEAGSAPSSSGGYGDSGGGSAPSSSNLGAKLNRVASIGSGGGNSQTAGSAGSTHGKFFGSGNEKAEFASSLGADFKKAAAAPAQDKRGTVNAMLNNTLAQSKQAARADNLASARGDAGNPFGGSGKGSAAADLKSTARQGASEVSGIEDGQATGNLKTNDPSLNKSKITPPTPPKEDTSAKKDSNEELKQMFIKMLMQAMLGMVFGGIGG
ncbi:MAG TPA: hypothetical protein PKI19_03790 [Elusimicrobiales bacterium]|nr:hypothetical protein [Elusimicrobiales bacterium]